MKIYLAIMLSFGIYLFPLPTEHHQFMSTWGSAVIAFFHDAADYHMEAIGILGLVALYQVFAVYCIYRFLDFTITGMLIFCIPFILFLYGILIFFMYGRKDVVHFFEVVWKIVSY